MVSWIFSQRPAIGGIEQGVRLALIVEHDLRQVIARNCRQRNDSICGRTGSLFFPSTPRVRCFAFMDRSSLSAPQHDHHGTHSQQGCRQNNDKEQAQRRGGNA